VEDKKGSWVGTVGERELGDEDLRAEDDSRGIGYFDRDHDQTKVSYTLGFLK
jgi:hypothetical protein